MDLPTMETQDSCLSASPEATRALGELIGHALREGDVLFLIGDLGAGKTQLTKGIASALGAQGEVTSPTFALQMTHPCIPGERPGSDTSEVAPTVLHHFDLYRIEDEDQLEDLGLYDVIGEEGVCVVEWGERFSSLMDAFDDRILIRLAYGQDEGTRIIAFDEGASRARELLAAVREALA